MKKLSREARERYLNTFEKGYRWYLDQQEADGSLGTPPSDEATFYNTLYVFSLGGRWREAKLFTDWAKKHIISTDGTLRVDPDGIFASRAVYFKAWHIYGAHRCEQFDMSLKAIDALLPYQNNKCGGFYVTKHGRDTGKGLVELNTTGMGGLACLVTGRMKEAIAAGNFQIELLSKQPNIKKGLYGYMDPKDGRLITEMKESDDIYRDIKAKVKSELDKYLFYYDNQSNERQAYANLGVPFVLLCCLYQATGNSSYLDAGMKLFNMLDRVGEKCWTFDQTTKVLWGLSLLYDSTEDENVFKAIGLMCEHFSETQLDNGAWIAPLGWDSFDTQPKWASICLAGDILLSIASVLNYVG